LYEFDHALTENLKACSETLRDLDACTEKVLGQVQRHKQEARREKSALRGKGHAQASGTDGFRAMPRLTMVLKGAALPTELFSQDASEAQLAKCRADMDVLLSAARDKELAAEQLVKRCESGVRTATIGCSTTRAHSDSCIRKRLAETLALKRALEREIREISLSLNEVEESLRQYEGLSLLQALPKLPLSDGDTFSQTHNEHSKEKQLARTRGRNAESPPDSPDSPGSQETSVAHECLLEGLTSNVSYMQDQLRGKAALCSKLMNMRDEMVRDHKLKTIAWRIDDTCHKLGQVGTDTLMHTRPVSADPSLRRSAPSTRSDSVTQGRWEREADSRATTASSPV